VTGSAQLCDNVCTLILPLYSWCRHFFAQRLLRDISGVSAATGERVQKASSPREGRSLL